jgi:hypothetical protein
VAAREGVIRLRYAVFGEPGVSIAARYAAHPDRADARHDWIRVPSNLPSGLEPLVLGDDRGNRLPLEFNGSGNDDRWRAYLSSERSIATDSAWLELDGTRVECRDRSIPAEVWTEQLRSADPARDHLWRMIAAADHEPPRKPPAATVDALVAAGALAADDPVLAQFDIARRAVPRRFGEDRFGRGGQSLEEPWASLIRRRGRADGPTGTLQIGAATPEFDGHRVAVDFVESRSSGFTVVFAESPRAQGWGWDARTVEDHHLIWWARDDRGNCHLAYRDDAGDQSFSTPLDPRATRLELLPTTPRARAVISFALT